MAEERGARSGVRIRQYKGDPFKPRPHLRVGPKSRRQHPIPFCIRTGLCKNSRKCSSCFAYSLWVEKEIKP